ncbi:MAG TPA: hypothetical protein VGG39_23980 [Polyangiaceae bacterium]|jgi:hypothetical protein
MKSTKIVGKLMALFFVGSAFVACYADVQAGGGGDVECRNTLRRRGDVETCRTRCGDEGCRTHCAEQERWAHEHHCWID